MPILLGALFAAMVVVALWAWVVVPPGRRFSLRVGAPPAFDATLGKRAGLLLWLALGTIVLVGSLLAEADNPGLGLVGAALLLFLLVMQVVSVRR